MINVTGGGPQIDQAVDSVVEAEEGSYTALRCIAYGDPRPVIMWQKGSTLVSLKIKIDVYTGVSLN